MVLVMMMMNGRWWGWPGVVLATVATVIVHAVVIEVVMATMGVIEVTMVALGTMMMPDVVLIIRPMGRMAMMLGVTLRW